MNKMEIVGNKHNTDKVFHHEYHKIYDLFLKELYDKEGCMLEIGLGRNNSLAMWLELFPNMYIYGVDVIYKAFHTDRCSIFNVDQSKPSQLEFLKSMIKEKCYFINDDGSHIPEHQLLTFNKLFPKLENGGIYIIEDIETSYWTKGECYGYKTEYGRGHKNSIIEIFKQVVDGINLEFSNHTSPDVMHQECIECITFYRNCIIIKKKEPKKRDYRFSMFL